MPTGTEYGKSQYPSGFRQIGKLGPSSSNQAFFFYPFAWRDVAFLFEDFVGGGLIESGVTDFNEGNFAAGVSNTGGSFDIIATQLIGGIARGTTGAFIADTIGLWGEDCWLGDQNAGCEFRFKLDDIDNQNFEVGFTDPLSNETLVALSGIDSPGVENGAADIAIIARMTGETADTLNFLTDGSTSNMNTTATALGTRNYTNTIYGGARVQLSGNSAYGYVIDANSQIVESAGHGGPDKSDPALASQIEGGTLVHPGIRVEALADSAINLDVDYIAVWQDRI